MYEKYIKLGFKRIEMHDAVLFNQIGYYGFILSKKINKNMIIQVCNDELDKPTLYINKKDSITSHSLEITFEMVMDIFKK
jgi:hypothetical protein